MFNMLFRLVLLQYFITALSSALNAVYFWRYRSPLRRRRLGAVVLSVVSAATLVESLYLGMFALSDGSGRYFPSDPRWWLGAGLLVCLGSLLLSGLILRQILGRRP